jgi:SNF2 family DNA or RNA helicase
MKIIHAFWSPSSGKDLIQSGQFGLWVETLEPIAYKNGASKSRTIHPRQMLDTDLAAFAQSEWQINAAANQLDQSKIELPTFGTKPLPCPELSGFFEHDEQAEKIIVKPWQVHHLNLKHPLQALNFIHFLSQYQSHEYRLGSDFLFWYEFAQDIRQALVKEQFMPQLLQCKDPKSKAKTAKTNIYQKWQLVSGDFEDSLIRLVKQMPQACTQGFEPQSLLRHVTEVVVNQHLNEASEKTPKTVQNKFGDSIIRERFDAEPLLGNDSFFVEKFEQWHPWQHKIHNLTQSSDVQLCFRLQDARSGEPDSWTVHFVAASRKDPSFKLDLAECWAKSAIDKAKLKPLLGADFEHQILGALGGAARIYPMLWQGMNSQHPASIQLTMNEAFAFLKESAWVLEDAGFKVIVPAWWTPQGRQRAKVKLRSKGSSSSSSANDSKGLLSLDSLIDYRYELAIGDQPVTPAEWAQLVEAKSPLVEFRGQWMELEQDKMDHMLTFWQQHGNESPQAPMAELIKTLAEQSNVFEVAHDDALSSMLSKLTNNSSLEPIEDPEHLNATLRDYQKRGVSWLRYLEQLNLNGCLADDMGLGKTIQVIATMVIDHEKRTGPTLLIAPTSVMGNWQKEVEKFAPQLKTHIHHGGNRLNDKKDFNGLCNAQDMLITSYSLARRDAKLIGGVKWQRIVLDEAQNIKNPKAAQTKAIFKLKANNRLALTGTPVENRLLDLWSIFNFLNPGYLGTQAQFRKTYELPIQKNNSLAQSKVLKKLIEPFILRRMKTDKNIIKDLPDKVENKQYCNLSKEQAALYEAVVNDVNMQLAEKYGIERQGLMLSTLTKLKQICNHPMQFLQDGSEFTPERSHKLERLGEMLDEAQAEGDSVLIFTQFTEIGDKLVQYLSREKQLNCYYIHGGVARTKREKMIEEFQDPSTGPSVFVLSLKAGGVGITLTRANHVFHFDRWWNPAVENQATDRAFRIGQKKNVFVHKYITIGTLEERIDEMIEDKKQMADSIVGTDEGWLTKLDNDAFKSLIALNKLTVVGE